MDERGFIAPTTVEEAEAVYDDVAPVAREVIREVTVAIDPGGDLYRNEVTPEVLATTRAALFASLLRVSTGPRAAFDAWLDQPPYDEFDIEIEGSEHVEHVAWHAAPMANRVLAATYHAERDAAIATLRRMAWGKIYHPVVADRDTDDA